MASKLVPANTPNDGLPSNFMPVDEPPIIANDPIAVRGAPRANPRGPDAFFSGSIPLPMQLTPDIMPVRYPGGIGGYRIMPPILAGVPGVNAAIKSFVGPPGAPGPAGAAGAPGPAGSGSDGLIHGDTIWDIDDAVFWLRDDFSAFSAVGSGSSFSSQLYWNFVLASSSGDPPTLNATPPHFGGLHIDNTATASQASFLIQGIQQAWVAPQTQLWPLIEYPSWKLVWEFEVCGTYQYTNISTINAFNWAQVSCYLGLGSFPNLGTLTISASPRPPYFIGLRYDTDPTSPAITDADFVFEAVANSTNSTARSVLNAQGTVVHTGIVPTQGTSYRLEMTCTTTGQVVMTLSNGTTTFSSTLTMPKFNAGSGSEALISNGIGIFYPGVPPPCGPGTRMTISGCTGSFTPFNGTLVAVGGGGSNWTNYLMSGSVAFNNVTGTPVCSCYPAMLPYVAFGNDSSASPVGVSKGITIDFFGFVWNPGAGGGTGTPNPIKARYW